MDMEYVKIKDKLDKMEVNTTTAREHVGEMEQGIWLVKEWIRLVISDLRLAGFTHLYKMIVVHCVYFVVMMLNAVPADNGISENFIHVESSQVARLTWRKIAEQSLVHMLKQAKMLT